MTPNYPLRPIERDEGIKDAKFSPSGEKILATSNKGTVRIWDFNGNLLYEIIDDTDSIHLAAFGENDQLVITNSIKNVNKVWQLPIRNKL